MLCDELDELDREFGLEFVNCTQCGRELLSWEEDTGYCDICTNQWLISLNERGDIRITEEWLEFLGEDE